MKRFFCAMMAAFAFLSADICLAETVKVDENRTVYLRGEVGRNAMEAAEQVLELAEQSHDDIWMVINSPGGNVIAGIQLLQAMEVAQHRGIHIQCVVPNMAASMAFVTLAQCDRRYALNKALLLWHPMRMGASGGFTRQQAQEAARDMARYERPLMRLQWQALRVSWRFFLYHYQHETLWTAEALHEATPSFLTLVDDIEGVKNLMSLQ